MRWLAGVVAVVCTGAVGLGIAHTYSTRLKAAGDLDATVDAVRRVQREIAVRSATKSAPVNERGYPTTIDPAWFAGDHPSNALMDEAHPWLEIASVEEAELQHPEVRVAVSEHTPTMWYNPYQGVVRARVPVSVSDDEALSNYNRVNASNLPSLFWKEPQPTKPISSPGSDQAIAQNDTATQSSTNTTNKAAKGPNALSKRKKKQAVVVVHRHPKGEETAHAGE